jgi:hypothetical protein
MSIHQHQLFAGILVAGKQMTQWVPEGQTVEIFAQEGHRPRWPPFCLFVFKLKTCLAIHSFALWNDDPHVLTWWLGDLGAL